MQLQASRSLLLKGVLVMITVAMNSAFFSTTPSVTSIGALHQEKAHRVGGGSTKICRCIVFPFHRSRLALRRPSEMLMVGAGAGNILSDAIAHTHSHLLSGSEVKVGLMLLAEESGKPGNIYGQIALGGVAIAFSAVFGAYIIATLVANMSTEDLMKLNKDLAGGDEYEELEKERERTQAKLADLSQQMEDAKDPARSLKLAPDGIRERKLEELTTRASTDIASIDDEYSD